MNEFELIDKYFKKNCRNRLNLVGSGDDAAVSNIPEGYQLVTSVDTLVKDTHFTEQTPALDIGHKSLAVSLSDMAAMGAEPFAVLLSLTLPAIDESWLNEFSIGFFNLADQFNTDLIGGNISKGPVSISTTILGIAKPNQLLLRSGANVNDLICVTGTLGDAAHGLAQLQSQSTKSCRLIKRLHRPTPRVEAGKILADIATAAIDISDGLSADLQKLLFASNKGAIIYTEKLPISEPLLEDCGKETAIDYALHGGEDYELCFTINESDFNKVHQALSNMHLRCTCIGQVSAEQKLVILDEHGHPTELSSSGYDHFAKKK